MLTQFTPYTQPQRPSEWSIPLDPQLYAQGIATQAKRADEKSAYLSNIVDKILGIQAIAPQDEKVLKEKQQQLLSDISKLNMGNLTDARSSQQIQNYINQYTNDPDILSVAKKSAELKSELAAEKEAISKGKTYYSPKLNKIKKYIQDGVYLTDVDFGRQGYIAPEVFKYQQDIQKNNTKETMGMSPDGKYQYKYNKIDGNKAGKQWYEALATNEDLNKYYRDKFEEEYSNFDWDSQAKDILYNAYNQSMELAQAALDSGDEQMAQYYQNKAKSQLSAAENNQYSAYQIKEKMFDDYLREDAQKFATSIDALDLKDIQEDAYKLEQFKTGQNLYEYKEKLKADAGLIEGVPAKQQPSKQLNINGQNIDLSYYSDVLNSAFSNTPTQSSIDQIKDWAAVAYNKSNPSKQVDAVDLVVEKEGGNIAIYKNKYKLEDGKRVPDGKEKIRTYSKSDLITTLTPGAQKDIENYEKTSQGKPKAY